MSTISIVPFNDDLHRSQVTALWVTVFGYETAHNEPGLAIERKVAVQDGLFFVALKGDTIVGTTMAGYDGHRGWLYSVAVAPGYRQQRIGSQLVACAERALLGLDCVKINLQILPGNEAATAFYAALGYSMEPRVNMGKVLRANVPPA